MKLVSILIPVYNCENYIKECLESCLAQDYSNIEIVIIDDGSTDKTKEIIESFKSDKIKYTYKNHTNIADALNLGITKCNGDYIARMDGDDIMLSDRISHQVKRLENESIGMVSNSFIWYKGTDKDDVFKLKIKRLNKNVLNLFKHSSNFICHPTVMIRADILRKLPYVYNQTWVGAEDLDLWIRLMEDGVKIEHSDKVVLKYRQHEKQTTANSPGCYIKGVSSLNSAICRCWNNKNNINYNGLPFTPKLTIIISFQNEGFEIEKTIQNIRISQCSVNILLIDDCSDDNYDYKKIADRYGCDYYKSEHNLGVAGARDKGVELCKTEYFVLLDGHMRFYEENWASKIIRILDADKNLIICSQTHGITRNGVFYTDEIYPKEKTHGATAATVNLKEKGYEFTAKWNYDYNKDNIYEGIAEVGCVLGGFYASSKTWWNTIGGLAGLIKYGSDEPLMSIKTWLAGGRCICLTDFPVGHIYRNQHPYKINMAEVDSNIIFLMFMFCVNNSQWETSKQNFKDRIGEYRFNEAYKIFTENRGYYTDLKMEFFLNKAKRNMNYFLAKNH